MTDELRTIVDGLYQLSYGEIEILMKQSSISRKGGSTKRQSIWTIEAKMVEDREFMMNKVASFLMTHSVQKRNIPSIPLSSLMASQNDPVHLNLLGDFSRTGYGAPKDLESSILYYHRAALMENLEGIYNLGLILDIGETEIEASWRDALVKTLPERTLRENEAGMPSPGTYRAEYWLRKAAHLGVPDAAYKLGWTFRNRNWVQDEQSGAIYWYTKAALAGHPYAQYNLGLCYKNGNGVTADMYQAVKWIRSAAEQNDPDAQHSLGLRYKSGEGVKKDEHEAVRWFTKAASQGYGFSQYHLGSMYKKGLGTLVDYYKSFEYFRDAASQGDQEALKKLKKFNEEPILSELLTSRWPLTQHKLNPNCQLAINEIILFRKFYLNHLVPIEVWNFILLYVIRLWPEPHGPFHEIPSV
eukprot:TRINITY_DN1067_c0_g1_i1.p1 TRINITY_DN1067_c0_g1~~TRINITY_DN1067_c0_g1_i1.p1  ORF type:complete len:413 (+),score=66.67 TRINITY_DN1067_c0_g1_i1:121-1359(+)